MAGSAPAADPLLPASPPPAPAAIGGATIVVEPHGSGTCALARRNPVGPLDRDSGLGGGGELVVVDDVVVDAVVVVIVVDVAVVDVVVVGGAQGSGVVGATTVVDGSVEAGVVEVVDVVVAGPSVVVVDGSVEAGVVDVVEVDVVVGRLVVVVVVVAGMVVLVVVGVVVLVEVVVDESGSYVTAIEPGPRPSVGAFTATNTSDVVASRVKKLSAAGTLAV